MTTIHLDSNKLHFLEVIGRGSFGVVHKAVWRGITVAAKVMSIIGNEKSVQTELSVYRYVSIY